MPPGASPSREASPSVNSEADYEADRVESEPLSEAERLASSDFAEESSEPDPTAPGEALSLEEDAVTKWWATQGEGLREQVAKAGKGAPRKAFLKKTIRYLRGADTREEREQVFSRRWNDTAECEPEDFDKSVKSEPGAEAAKSERKPKPPAHAPPKALLKVKKDSKSKKMAAPKKQAAGYMYAGVKIEKKSEPVKTLDVKEESEPGDLDVKEESKPATKKLQLPYRLKRVKTPIPDQEVSEEKVGVDETFFGSMQPSPEEDAAWQELVSMVGLLEEPEDDEAETAECQSDEIQSSADASKPKAKQAQLSLKKGAGQGFKAGRNTEQGGEEASSSDGPRRLKVPQREFVFDECSNPKCKYRIHWNPHWIGVFGKFCCGKCSEEMNGEFEATVSAAPAVKIKGKVWSHCFHGKKCNHVPFELQAEFDSKFY